MAENGKEEYIKELEETISEFLKPLKNIPFRIAIKAISGCDVIPFNKNNPNDKQLLMDLIAATRLAVKMQIKVGYSRGEKMRLESY